MQSHARDLNVSTCVYNLESVGWEEEILAAVENVLERYNGH